MTMSEEILGLLRQAGTHQTADELLKLADGVFLEGSFKTTLAAMALKSKAINRYDLRNIGKGFLYGLPEWPSPSAMPKAAAVKQEPLVQKELRERLERQAKDRAAIATAPPHPIPSFVVRDRISKPEEPMDKKVIGKPEPPEQNPGLAGRADEWVRADRPRPAPTIPLIEAIDTGIYRIRGTNLLMQVNETGVDVYRIGE